MPGSAEMLSWAFLKSQAIVQPDIAPYAVREKSSSLG